MSTVTMSSSAADYSLEFEDLFREHHVLVYRTACAITGSPQDAEDVLQTIFLRLLRRSVPPDLHQNPKGYFYRAAVRLSLDTIQSRQREVLTSDFTTMEGRMGAEEIKASDALDPRLIQMLAKLKPRTVEIIMLRYVHDYAEKDI